jgi:hypothetical protein
MRSAVVVRMLENWFRTLAQFCLQKTWMYRWGRYRFPLWHKNTYRSWKEAIGCYFRRGLHVCILCYAERRRCVSPASCRCRPPHTVSHCVGTSSDRQTDRQARSTAQFARPPVRSAVNCAISSRSQRCSLSLGLKWNWWTTHLCSCSVSFNTVQVAGTSLPLEFLFLNISCLYFDKVYIIISHHDVLETSKAQHFFRSLGNGVLKMNQTEQFFLSPNSCVFVFSTRQF